MEDFDKYLSGEMSDGERQQFEQALADDPVLQAELQVRVGLRQLRLEKKVREVSTARMAWERKRIWRRILLGFAIAGLFGLAIFIWFNTGKTPPPPSNIQETEQETPVGDPLQPAEKEKNVPVLPEEKTRKPKRQDIAEAQQSNDQLPAPQVFPNLRGEGAAATEIKNLLDQIWYAQYPPSGMKPTGVFAEADALLMEQEYEKAYAKLQRLERKLPENDTLNILKGYCLMNLGEGTEALRYFGGAEEQPLPVRQLLEWYRGQCLLLSGDKAGALAAFKAIAGNPGHGYQRHSKNAVRILE